MNYNLDFCIVGNETIGNQLQAEISPSGSFTQSLLNSNNDGTYLLTVSSSLAANYLISLKVSGVAVANASLAVAPRTADATRSLVTSPDFGTLGSEVALRLTAGRSYEFGSLLFDIFGNKAADEGKDWFLEALVTGSSGTASFVSGLDQQSKRWTVK